MAVSETVIILAGGVVVIAILIAIRRAMVASGGAGTPVASAGTGSPDTAGVIALPPLIYLGFLVAATVLEAVVPLSVVAYPTGRHIVGAALVLAGFGSIFAAASRFRTAGTNIPPDLPTTALVTEGIYARTRNPIYLGSTLVYLGLAVAAGSLWAIVLMVPVLWLINVGVIAREESYLERKFGDAYRKYKGRVRRWV